MKEIRDKMNTTARVVSPGKVCFMAASSLDSRCLRSTTAPGTSAGRVLGIATGTKAVLKKGPPGLGHRHPKMIAAWEWGEKDRFGKSYAKVFREQE